MGTLMIELLIGPTTFPTLFQVITVQSPRDMFAFSEPMLQISHSEDDLFLIGFTFDEVQTLEVEDFCRDFVAMSFDQHSSTVVIDMMREANYRYMVRLHRERVRARLTCTPFDYPVHPYRMSLVDYFIRGSEVHPHMGDFGTVTDIDGLGDETFGAPILVMIAHSVDVKPTGVTDGVVPRDEYQDEMDMMKLMEDVAIGDDLFEDTFSSIVGASADFVDLPLSVEILLGFISSLDDVYDSASMYLSIFEYLPISYRDSFDHELYPINERVSSATRGPRELKIGSPLSTDERDRLTHLLRSYLDVKEEIQKQLSVGFISVVEYPKWLANVISVPKKDGKVRVCVDFRDLNKASPKDDFPLPHIDLLVDSTTGHSMLSFMDGFLGYNQILMALKDMEKTIFITKWSTYCYRVMPFGLKNVGATYHRVATTLFHDMMHRDVEVYVDDMIVKFRGRADHLATLERFFERIQIFRLRLNPKKSTFGRGIEVDLDKIKAILDMPMPRTEKEIRGFLGRFVKKSIKGSIVADHFSLPISEGKLVDYDFPNEEFIAMASLSDWCMYLMVQPTTQDRHPATNNIIKYEAYILSLEIVVEIGIRQMETEVQDDLPWYHGIYQLLRFDTYPGATQGSKAPRRSSLCGSSDERGSWESLRSTHERTHARRFHRNLPGHEFILVAIDYFTKWVEAHHMRG
ncbi:hypothetical protein AAG906_003566 [Vitis piasezkii]